MFVSADTAPQPRMSVALAAGYTVRDQLRQVAQKLEGLPALSNARIPDLATNIDSIKSHAASYLGDLSSEIDALDTEIVTFGTALDESAGKALKKLDAGAPEAVETAQSIMKRTLHAGRPVQRSLKQLSGAIGAFADSVETDSRHLLEDQHIAQELVAADEARLRALNAKLNTLRSELKSKRTEEVILGILTGGIAAAIMELTGYVESTERDIDEARRQAHQVHEDVAQYGAISASLTTFVNGTQVLSGLAAALQKGVQTVNTNLKEVVHHQLPASFLAANIRSIELDWQQVADQAKHLRS